MTRKSILVVTCSALAICFIMLLVVGGGYSPPTTYLTMSAVRQTEEAFQSGNDTSGIHLSIRTDKVCYLPNEPVPMWIELFNSSDEPVTVLKSLSVDKDNEFHGISTFVNGTWDERMIQMIEVLPPQENEYITLYPNELVATYFPNFWDLTSTYCSPTEVSIQTYDFQVEYHNWVPGIRKDIVILPNGDVEVSFDPNNSWIGHLQSNVVSIDVVSSLEDCPLSQ